MGLIRAQVAGDGMDITGRGRNIQVRIIEILERGVGTSRVRLRISGVQDINELEIAALQPPTALGDGVTVAVCEGMPYGSFNKNKVAINYSAPWHYILDRVEP